MARHPVPPLLDDLPESEFEFDGIERREREADHNDRPVSTPGTEHIIQLGNTGVITTMPRGRLKRAPQPLGIRKLQGAYIRNLHALLRNLHTLINVELAKDLEKAIGFAEARLKFDIAHWEARMEAGTRYDDGTDIIERTFAKIRVAFLRERSPENLRSVARAQGLAINTRNIDNIRRQYKAVLGVDVLSSEPWIKEEVAAFVRENVSLIESVTDEHLTDIEQIVMRNVKAGKGPGVIASELAKRFSLTSNRANLIARDQTTKFHSRLNQLRYKQHGITRYTWRTSQDARVRGKGESQGPNHRRLNNKVFSWDDPPVTNRNTGTTNHPGEDIQCRCWAEPFFEDLLK